MLEIESERPLPILRLSIFRLKQLDLVHCSSLFVGAGVPCLWPQRRQWTITDIRIPLEDIIHSRPPASDPRLRTYLHSKSWLEKLRSDLVRTVLCSRWLGNSCPRRRNTSKLDIVGKDAVDMGLCLDLIPAAGRVVDGTKGKLRR